MQCYGIIDKQHQIFRKIWGNCRQYRVCRKVIYDWKKKYDGKSRKSLLDRSHRPPHHPREHTPEEYALIQRYHVRSRNDRIVLWQKLRDAGYTRCYKSMAIKRMNLIVKVCLNYRSPDEVVEACRHLF